MPITRDDDVLHGQPRLAGTRIGVVHIYDMVVDAERTPAEVASSLDISVGEVYEALAYYYNNPAEIRERRNADAEALEELRERSVKPPTSESAK